VGQRIGSNRIANTSVTGLKVADNAIRGNNIVAGQITGNLLGTGVINSNNFVNGAVSSNTLASNLSMSLIRVLETANIYTTGVGGNVNIDVSNNTVYYFTSNTTANVTFNFRANGVNGGNLDSLLSIGQSVSSAILLKQGATRYRANVYIDSALQVPHWLGNSAPGYATTQQESIDTYSFNIIKTAANTYTVLASNSNFQTALNQNP
jgi:hypothetical protein